MPILCGIDEAGRGSLAGDLVVAGVILDTQIDGLMDSKRLSEKKKRVTLSRNHRKFKISYSYI